MTNAKEIRTKIATIKSTQKITRAMEMVAASKMRKAQERMYATRAYGQTIRRVVSHLASATMDVQHPYLIERPAKRIGIVVVSSDRGLAGGLNANVFKVTVQLMKKWHKAGAEIDICTIGRKAEAFFRRMGGNVIGSKVMLGERPGIEDLGGIIRILLDAFEAKQLDRIFIVSNRYVNSMVQTPEVELLLPVVPPPPDPKRLHWDYIYEPDAISLIQGLLVRYLESLTYQAVIENIASEQAARRMAMKNASDNAADLVEELQLKCNKARQASITQELTEIIAGAAAV